MICLLLRNAEFFYKYFKYFLHKMTMFVGEIKGINNDRTNGAKQKHFVHGQQASPSTLNKNGNIAFILVS